MILIFFDIYKYIFRTYLEFNAIEGILLIGIIFDFINCKLALYTNIFNESLKNF